MGPLAQRAKVGTYKFIGAYWAMALGHGPGPMILGHITLLAQRASRPTGLKASREYY